MNIPTPPNVFAHQKQRFMDSNKLTFLRPVIQTYLNKGIIRLAEESRFASNLVLILKPRKSSPADIDMQQTEFTNENKCSVGAYEVSRTKSEIDVTILATGSEVELATEVSQKLAIEKIYSKVISMPCHELFDIQKKDYKSKILNETKHKISIEASTTDYWKKYIGENGIAFGIDTFGKSAPYKAIYEHFGLTSKNIVKKVKEMINNKT